MKLEVGMYVRSKINGMIAKITDTEILCVRNPVIEAPYTKDIRYILDNNLNRGFCESEKDSVKASHNIIDLIEVGDYVNGHRVEYIDDCKGAMREFYWFDEYETNQCGHYFEEIKSIVTKEQFESMSYKLGDKEWVNL